MANGRGRTAMRVLIALCLVCLVCILVGAGCTQNSATELAKAKEEAEAARGEVASLRADLAKARADLDSLRGGSDLKQARFVAEGFLTAITKPSVDQAHGFCTPDQRRRVATITIPPGKLLWSIDTEGVAANGREATFKGSFDTSMGKQTFVVLVIKVADKGQDRWLVDAFSVSG